MTASRMPAGDGRQTPRPAASREAPIDIAITLDGVPMSGQLGQTIAGIFLGSGVLSWRTTAVTARPRGVFCGIGVCFDCIAEVNGQRDVRTCQRRAADGDVIRSQHDAKPAAEPSASPPPPPASPSSSPGSL